jgi:hypothetical protein
MNPGQLILFIHICRVGIGVVVLLLLYRRPSGSLQHTGATSSLSTPSTGSSASSKPYHISIDPSHSATKPPEDAGTAKPSSHGQHGDGDADKPSREEDEDGSEGVRPSRDEDNSGGETEPASVPVAPHGGIQGTGNAGVQSVGGGNAPEASGECALAPADYKGRVLSVEKKESASECRRSCRFKPRLIFCCRVFLIM